MRFCTWVLPLGLLSISGLNSPLSAQNPAPVVQKRTAYEDLQMFSQVLNQIRTNHPDSIESHTLIMAAIRGMIGAADPHSYVIPALRLDPKKEEQLSSGKLVTVPIAFDFAGGTPIVVSVSPGSVAARSDILQGDMLVAVDSKPVVAESAFELEISLAGAKGSSLTLSLERRREDGSIAKLERRVVRERVGEATAVPAVRMLDSTTGYIRVTTFMGAKVADDLHKALERLEDLGMQRLLLDLRDNGGGSIDEAARVAGEFLPEGRIVFTATGRKAELVDTGKVKRAFWKSQKRYPIIVLVNEGTASASELVAGALQDHDRALIAGRATFGKSLMMRGFPLTDGSIIVLVVGHVRTPCGRVVQRQYRSITRRDYFRLAGADRDTAGRPSCQTTMGRTVYGGGGIYPDAVSEQTTSTPPWLAKAREQLVIATWAAGYVSSGANQLSTLDAYLRTLALAPDAAASFRAFAGKQGIVVPAASANDTALTPVLLEAIAYAKWGEEGAYNAVALLDPEVRQAMGLFPRAAALTGNK